MDKLMIDLETLGPDQTSMIIELGAILFSKDEDGPELEFKVNIESYPKNYTIDPGTVKWWMAQVEKGIKNPIGNGVHYSQVTTKLVSWLMANTRCPLDQLKVYAKGHLDHMILEYHGAPFHYRNLRYMRDLEDLVNDKYQWPEEGKHSALQDCKEQIKYLRWAYDSIHT